MINSFKIQNLSNKKSINFTQDLSSPFTFDNSEIDWGNASAQHSTYNVPGQVGSYISSTTIKERTISIQGYTFYIPNSNERLIARNKLEANIDAQIEKNKAYLSEVVNPFHFVKVIIGDYSIVGKPESSIVFKNKIEDNNAYFCKFVISIYCNNPMFRKNNETSVVLSGSASGWHFPLVIPKTGFVIGTQLSYSLITVPNVGDVPVGAIFTLEATGVVSGITITNIYTGQNFKIHKTLEAGEKIVVNTTKSADRAIKGYLHGEEKNYFEYWDFEGEWLQFEPGTSLIGYSLDEGYTQNLKVSLKFNPEKFSLGGL